MALQVRSEYETEDGYLNLDTVLEEIEILYSQYGLESDDNLTKGAKKIKQKVMYIVNEIKKL